MKLNKPFLVFGIVLVAIIGIKLPTSVMAVTPTGTTYGMEVETKEVQGLSSPFSTFGVAAVDTIAVKGGEIPIIVAGVSSIVGLAALLRGVGYI